MSKTIKIAFVYDRVNSWGGAERVLLALHEIWPEAPLFTAVYNANTASWAKVFKVIPSGLQNFPLAKSHHQYLSLFTAKAFSRFDFSAYDVVLSITSAEAKFIKTSPKTLHICYCLTPTRYLWSQKDFYEKLGFKGKILKLTAPLSRMKDFETAQNIDHIISISSYIQKQVYKYYQRENEVIYPSVEVLTESEAVIPMEKDYYLVVSRMVAYKRIDLAIAACRALNKKLVVVGNGEQKKELSKKASPNIIFVNNLTEGELAGYYMHCKALLFPGREDFGIAPVEAQAYGKPVIAYGAGGVLDTVIDEKTGLFFDEQSVEKLAIAIENFEAKTFSSLECRKNALKFSKQNFQLKIKKFIENKFKN